MKCENLICIILILFFEPKMSYNVNLKLFLLLDLNELLKNLKNVYTKKIVKKLYKIKC